MNMMKNLRFYRMCVCDANYKIILILALCINLFICSSRQIDNDILSSTNAVLVGFSLNKGIFSACSLEWYVPRIFILSYIFIFFHKMEERFLFTIIRVKSRKVWFLVNNISSLTIIVAWFFISYGVLVLNYILRSDFVSIPYSIVLKLFIVDVLTLYLMYNIFFVITLLSRGIQLASIICIGIYFSAAFTNKPSFWLFQVIPTNHEMLLRQQYVNNSLTYLIISSLFLVVVGMLIFIYVKENFYE